MLLYDRSARTQIRRMLAPRVVLVPTVREEHPLGWRDRMMVERVPIELHVALPQRAHRLRSFQCVLQDIPHRLRRLSDNRLYGDVAPDTFDAFGLRPTPTLGSTLLHEGYVEPQRRYRKGRRHRPTLLRPRVLHPRARRHLKARQALRQRLPFRRRHRRRHAHIRLGRGRGRDAEERHGNDDNRAHHARAHAYAQDDAAQAKTESPRLRPRGASARQRQGRTRGWRARARRFATKTLPFGRPNPACPTPHTRSTTWPSPRTTHAHTHIPPSPQGTHTHKHTRVRSPGCATALG